MRCIIVWLSLLFATPVIAESSEEKTFVSVKVAKANIRKGPGRMYPILVELHANGYPLQVTDTHENWLKVRDYEGMEGWILKTLTSKVRTLIALEDNVPARTMPNTTSPKRFLINKKVVVGYLKTSHIDKDPWIEIRVKGEKVWSKAHYFWGL